MGDSGHELVLHRIQLFQGGDVAHDRHAADSSPVAVGDGRSTGIQSPTIGQGDLFYNGFLTLDWLGEKLLQKFIGDDVR